MKTPFVLVAAALLVLTACSSHSHTVYIAPNAVGPTKTVIEWQDKQGDWQTLSVSENGRHNFDMPMYGPMRVIGTNALYETKTVPLSRDELVVNLSMEEKPGVTNEQILAAINSGRTESQPTKN